MGTFGLRGLLAREGEEIIQSALPPGSSPSALAGCSLFPILFQVSVQTLLFAAVRVPSHPFVILKDPVQMHCLEETFPDPTLPLPGKEITLSSVLCVCVGEGGGG